MKNFLLILSFIGCVNVNSQELSFGPEIGLNLINIEKTEIGSNYSPSINIGGFVAYELSKYFSLKSGIYFTQKNKRYQSFDTSLIPLLGLIDIGEFDAIDLNTYSNTKSQSRQNYIQIPISIDFEINSLSLSAGMYFGYSISSRTKSIDYKTTPIASLIDVSSIDSTGLFSLFIPKPYEEIYSEDNNLSHLKAFDYGFKFGLGYRIDDIRLNASYLYGISDFSSIYPENHQYIQLGIQYVFGTGGSLKSRKGKSKRINLSR